MDVFAYVCLSISPYVHPLLDVVENIAIKHKEKAEILDAFLA